MSSDTMSARLASITRRTVEAAKSRHELSQAEQDRAILLSHLGAQVAALREASEEVERLRKSRDDYRDKFSTLLSERNGEVWIWQGDGHDHPESLSCPVLVQAEQVREFVAAQAELKRAYMSIQDSIRLTRECGAEVLPMILEEGNTVVGVMGVDSLSYDNADNPEIPSSIRLLVHDVAAGTEERRTYTWLDLAKPEAEGEDNDE